MTFYKLFYLLHHRTDFIDMYRFERETMMWEEYEQRDINDLNHKHRQNLAMFLGLSNALAMRLDGTYFY